MCRYYSLFCNQAQNTEYRGCFAVCVVWRTLFHKADTSMGSIHNAQGLVFSARSKNTKFGTLSRVNHKHNVDVWTYRIAPSELAVCHRHIHVNIHVLRETRSDSNKSWMVFTTIWSHIKRRQLESLLWEHFTVISFSLAWRACSNEKLFTEF